MESFALLVKYEHGLIAFDTIRSIYSKCKSAFTPKSVMNKPQAEGRVNHICPGECSTLFSNKKNNEAQLLVYLKSFLLIGVIRYLNLACEIHFHAYFSSNPNQTYLSMLISIFRIIIKSQVCEFDQDLELNSAGKCIS